MVISLMHKIKFCKRNFKHHTDEILKKLEKNHKDLSVSTKSCIGYCGSCNDRPISLVNKNLFKADTADQLYDAIIETIQ
jgi:uncharacterized protein YuzB (UPF0349 family)